MFSKLSLLATSLWVATCQAQVIFPPPPPGTANLCCSTVGSSSNPTIQAIASLVDVDVFAIPFCVHDLFGINCFPIAAAAPVQTCSNTVTAVNCNVNPLGNSQLLQINFGCIPIP